MRGHHKPTYGSYLPQASALPHFSHHSLSDASLPEKNGHQSGPAQLPAQGGGVGDAVEGMLQVTGNVTSV